MAKSLIEVLDGIKVKYDDFSPYEFCDEVESKMGEGYEVEVWDHDDYGLGDLLQTTIGWIADKVKGKIIEDLQVQLYETDDPGDEAFMTVVALKTKE